MGPRKITSKELDIYSRKLPHWQQGGSWYFVTFRTKNIILDEAQKDFVIRSIAAGNPVYYQLAIAVAMPDHVHMIIRPNKNQVGAPAPRTPETGIPPTTVVHGEGYYPIGGIIRTIKIKTARGIKPQGEKGALWQREWFDRIIRNNDEWLEKYDYVRNNPVKAGIVERPEDYRWLHIPATPINY